MVKYKELYLKEKAMRESEEKTGMACPLCLEKGVRSELIYINWGELVCEKEDCGFDKTIGVILESYYFQKEIIPLERLDND